MQDPLISPPSEAFPPPLLPPQAPPSSLSHPSLPEAPTTPPETATGTRASPASDPEWAGRRLYSGTGEDLGVVLGVLRDRAGHPKWLRFVEAEGAPERKVRLDFVRAVDEEGIRLAGPREGYHITRLHR